MKEQQKVCGVDECAFQVFHHVGGRDPASHGPVMGLALSETGLLWLGISQATDNPTQGSYDYSHTKAAKKIKALQINVNTKTEFILYKSSQEI